MEKACVPTVRDATWRTPGCLCPEILCIVGIISISPCDDVKDVARLPASRAPCTMRNGIAALSITIEYRDNRIAFAKLGLA